MRSLLRAIVPYRLRLERWRRAWQRVDATPWPPHRASGLARYEYSLFSQNGEDGILRYLFEEAGCASRLFLEFGFGVTESNSLRLITQERFAGFFIEGKSDEVRALNETARLLGIENVRAVHQFLTLDNLAATIRETGLPPEIDLLSIDVDGNDYWFWDATPVRARVVVIEYNAILGVERSMTSAYDPQFARWKNDPSGLYGGASLEALDRLARRKGYVLVGCDSSGTNAFFVREDCWTDRLPRPTVAEAYRPPLGRLKLGLSVSEQFALIADLPHVQAAPTVVTVPDVPRYFNAPASTQR